ncbi:MAG: ATP synthase F1 subunit gamma [Candidatus Cloacimonadota bacterium]|nr:ATP synthase F1 subunit gamma [Candidatus Cloacimonadota bacterium]
MASLKDLKERIDSIKSTRQITSAMKMVAAAKLQKAQQNILNARPYANDINRMLTSLVTHNSQDNSPFLRQIDTDDPKAICIITVTSDKGLCGAFNSNIIRKTEELISKNTNKKIDLICIGKKSWKYFGKHRPKLVKHKIVDLFNKVEFFHSRDVMKMVAKSFVDKEYEQVLIIYNEFKSAIQQDIIVEQLLPILRIEENKNDDFVASYLMEQQPAELIDELIEKNIDVQIWKVLLESYSSEQGARMTAMEAATDNADDMIKELTLIFHHKRQENITTEIIEVSSAVEAQ